MPTYVYRFLDSDDTIEVQQAFSDDALTEAVHPTDGKLHPVKKVFLPVGVTFKGGGFYKTDSRGSNGSSGSSTSSKSTSDSPTTSSESSGSSSSSSSSDSSSTSSSSSTVPASTPSTAALKSSD
jgi:predicted nucleic acid-binding Zn ribbon protein